MSKIIPTKPLFIALYGYPGAGKTHFSRQLAEVLGGAHVQGDRIRYELFDKPKYDKSENAVVTHLMEYMSEEFLKSRISVIFDTNAERAVKRRQLRDMARKANAQQLLIWLQIDADSAFTRLSHRDKRKNDDKYAQSYDRPSFDTFIGSMQNPSDEDYMVISGKHTFNTQRSAVVKKLYDMGLVSSDSTTSQLVKPGLVNLIPNRLAGRGDRRRRSIVIRQ